MVYNTWAGHLLLANASFDWWLTLRKCPPLSMTVAERFICKSVIQVSLKIHPIKTTISRTDDLQSNGFTLLTYKLFQTMDSC